MTTTKKKKKIKSHRRAFVLLSSSTSCAQHVTRSQISILQIVLCVSGPDVRLQVWSVEKMGRFHWWSG
jgi:hypothetical protein